MVSILNLPLLIVSCVTLAEVFSDHREECVVPGQVAQEADYYWRDYVGVVPNDAIEGGFTQAGNITYIGHFSPYYFQGIFVGNIYAGKREAVHGMRGNKYSHSTYVQILCSGNKKRFEWRLMSADALHLLNDYHLVKGGTVNHTILYIGRATVDDQVKVGHVFPESQYGGLWIFKDDGTIINYDNFHILVLPR